MPAPRKTCSPPLPAAPTVSTNPANASLGLLLNRLAKSAPPNACRLSPVVTAEFIASKAFLYGRAAGLGFDPDRRERPTDAENLALGQPDNFTRASDAETEIEDF